MEKYRETIFGGVIFLVAVIYFAVATTIPEFNDGFISSDFMPKIYGVILMLLSGSQVFMGLRETKKKQNIESEKIIVIPEVLLTFLMLILYVALLNPLGFLISTILFLLGMVTLFTPREKRNVIKIILISVIFSVVVYLIFVKVFSLTLPQGIIG